MEKRKKYLSFITVLVVIILLHLLGLTLFFRDGGKPAPAVAGPSPNEAPAPADHNGEVGSSAPRPATVAKCPMLRLNYRYARFKPIPGIATGEATTGIMVNADSGYVLWAKNSRKAVPIASMTKMLTVLVAMEQIAKRSDISLATVVTVTRAAAAIGGSQVYLKQGEKFTLGELLKSMMVKSANDSAYLVAEFLGGGDVKKIIALMNRKARELHLEQTEIFNPNGLPIRHHKNNCSSPEDLARIAFELLHYPVVMRWAATRRCSFRDKKAKGHMILINTNKLLRQCPGVDGLKTGFINASGSCITVTCKRNGVRMIVVVTGFKSWRTRNAAVRKLLDWGYQRSSELTRP